MKTNTTFEYNPNLGITICEIQKGDKTFYGSAVCHPDDKDMISEYTGGEIANMRAEISQLQHIRDNEIKPALKILNHVYGCMAQSAQFNPKSHEAKIIRRQIKHLENELVQLNNSIQEERQFLYDYIKQKDRIYKRLREKAKKD